MIISFGGASSIGKTTLCQSFSITHVIIPEVNILCANEKRKGKFWYYEKQVERFQIAFSANKNAIFDGDVFQPIWYNWIYGYPKEFDSKVETHQFYLEKLIDEKICFPDLYIIFFANLEVLKLRKEKDLTRRRRNFEKHIRLIEPQKRYFEFLKKETDIQVEFVEFDNLEKVKKKVNELMNHCQPKQIDQVANFKKIEQWLEKQTPS